MIALSQAILQLSLEGSARTMRYFLATNDVELTSIRYNKQRIKSGEYVLNDGLPRLLELYKRLNVKSTFFVTGDIAEAFPAIPRLIVDYGHELGSHSFSHEDCYALDRLNLIKQKEQLSKSKKCLEDISGREVVSFRAPALRVNEFTAQALHETSYAIDSSISPQRADMFFSFGALKKINRLWASRYPGFVQKHNLSKRGDYPVFEIPISALAIPYIGTTMRIMPLGLKLLRYVLAKEAMLFGNPINFLIHPNECMLETDDDARSRRSNNPIMHLLAERLRGSLKIRNLGDAAIKLYAEHLIRFKQEGFKFVTCSEYFNNWNKDKEMKC
jgi:peptidoglycan/xylan/chitin deacetylase (PgdA/CDA1 family)